MKLLIIICSFIFLRLPLTANPVESESKITAVTVFPKGAMITREISVSHLSGPHNISIKNLPKELHPKSIILNANNAVEIISINSFLDFKTKKDTVLFSSLQNQYNTIKDSIHYYNTLISTLATEEDMITDHNNFTNDKGNANIDDVIKASEFYKKRIKEIRLDILKLRKAVTLFNSTLTKISSRKDSITKSYTTRSYTIEIKTKIEQINTDPIQLQYFVPNATWYAYYDLKVKNLNTPAVLNRKAFVSQNTGEKWTNVALTLSNANPLESNVLPILNPQTLVSPEQQYNSSTHTSFGTVKDQMGEPLIGANVMVEGFYNGVSTDINGYFKIENPHHKNILVSYTGYETKSLPFKNNYHVIYLYEDGEILEDVIIVGNSSNNSSIIDGIRLRQEKKRETEKNKLNRSMSLLRKAISQARVNAVNSVEFKIKDPYTIKSDNKEIDVLLEINDINCTYEHYAVPSTSSKVYLTMQIDNWYELDLLPGKVNLFLSNTYKGTSHINPNITQDTLNISVGHDPEVIVERKLVKEFYDKKIFRKNIEEQFSYLTTVKNNKTVPITIKILDQIPVSHHEDIEIKDVKVTGAEPDENSGKIEWNLEMLPGSSSEKAVSYKVKYPKKFGSIL